MAESLWLVQNAVRPTTAAPVKQPTGTAIRTMLQIATSSTVPIYIVEWGISFDGSAAATPIEVELFGTSVAATMSTALAAADVQNLTATATTAPLLVGTTAQTGFATAAVTEGTVANYRPFDTQLVAPTSQYVKQYPLGREPYAGTSTFIRVRVTAAASVNCKTYVIFGSS